MKRYVRSCGRAVVRRRMREDYESEKYIFFFFPTTSSKRRLNLKLQINNLMNVRACRGLFVYRQSWDFTASRPSYL